MKRIPTAIVLSAGDDHLNEEPISASSSAGPLLELGRDALCDGMENDIMRAPSTLQSISIWGSGIDVSRPEADTGRVKEVERFKAIGNNKRDYFLYILFDDHDGTVLYCTLRERMGDEVFEGRELREVI